MADVVYRIEVTGIPSGGLSGGNINDDDSSGGGKLSFPKPLTTRSAVKQITSGDVKVTNLLASAGISLAKYTISNAVETIGLRTGDTYRQQEIQFGLNLLSSIGGSALSGFVVSGGNPIGALVGAVMGTIKVGGEALISEYKANIKREWDRNFSQEKQRIYDYASYGANRTGGVLY